MRGAPSNPHQREVGPGIIPARAGSTPRVHGDSLETWDHPRSCGEHKDRYHRYLPNEGSSPLVRGARDTRRGLLRYDRDHPRSCGEHRRHAIAENISLGSSPLVRGAPPICASLLALRRIIPARAGSTPGRSGRNLPQQDHPRSCGEHGPIVTLVYSVKGSSPLVRGALSVCRHYASGHGIIPARAGNTTWIHSMGTGTGDHPRSCGEHTTLFTMLSLMLGSSPLVRGVRSGSAMNLSCLGIIPARAGST